MCRARVFGVIDTMAETGNLLLLRQQTADIINRVSALLIDGEEHAHDSFVSAAMQRAFERANSSGNGGMHVRKRRGDDASGKGGGVQFVIGVQDQGYVKGAGRCF